MTTHTLLAIALPVPLRKLFDYCLPEDCTSIPTIGARVEVPFGQQTMIGVIVAIKPASDITPHKIKAINNLIDENSIFSPHLLSLMLWASDYYQHPLGECLATAMPNLLRKGLVLPSLNEQYWQLNPSAPDCALPKGKRQLEVLNYLSKNPSFNKNEAKQLGFSASVLNALTDHHFITTSLQAPIIKPAAIKNSLVTLNAEQQLVIDEFRQQASEFSAYLLEGITGSGKTEVYLQLIAQTLAQGKQALILVPEIGLTPQTIKRFEERFACNMAIFHSNLSDKQRLHYWQQARDGIAQIIIGTRSALFTATQALGLIIIDEEHDLSYKQQDGLRYSARDLALVRAKLENIPIVLGSATPTLETLHNAISGKYHHWQLLQRAGTAQMPQVRTIDIRHQTLHDGLCEEAINAIHDCLQQQEQALIFINRRGFSPSLLCHDCGWVSQCHACDARLTVHLNAHRLRCHHCLANEPIPKQCPQCHSRELVYAGAGTERIENGLQQLFPHTAIFRIDRDSTQQKGSMQQLLADIQQQNAAILVGTQMLAKGHHFPNVTLVIVLDTDAALMGTDFRSVERFGQLLTQVTGRAGREQKPGLALIQTHYPHHELLHKLLSQGYHRFAVDVLAERKHLNLPPFSYQALIRLEDQNAERAQHTLQQLQYAISSENCSSLGPYPAALQRRAHFYRYQLLIQSPHRHALKAAIATIITTAQGLIKTHQQRWSIDIDPQDMS